MDKRIIYKNPSNGQIAIVVPAEPQGNETEEQYLDRIASRAEAQFHVPQEKVVIVDKSDLPVDIRWRNAWVWDGEKISVSVDKVREIRMEELGRQAKLELEKANAAFLEKLQAGEDATKEGQKATSIRGFIADPTSKVPKFGTVEEAESFDPFSEKE